MGRLFKAFVFKLGRDLTFRITLIIGIGMAVLMTLLYLGIDLAMETFGTDDRMLSGPNMLLNSLSPVQNFGIAIPVNLISFTCLEFTQGTIRNKIIAGNSKFKIYASLCISGLIFAFSLLLVYVGLCTLLGTIVGGFDLNLPIMVGLAQSPVNGTYIGLTLLFAALTYVSLVMFAIFMATLLRNIGPSIPVVMVALMLLYFGAYLVSAMSYFFEDSPIVIIMKIINPLYALSGGVEYHTVQATMNGVPLFNDDGTPIMVTDYVYYATDTIVCSIVNNIVYAALFFVFGSLIFTKRDVK